MADFEYISQVDATVRKTGAQPPLDFKHHFSRVTAARSESSVKRFYKYFQIPGIGNLAGGKSEFQFLHVLGQDRANSIV